MDDAEKAVLVSRMSALLTMKFEDGAEIATRAQGRHEADQLQEIAGDIPILSEEAVTVTMATIALLSVTL